MQETTQGNSVSLASWAGPQVFQDDPRGVQEGSRTSPETILGRVERAESQPRSRGLWERDAKSFEKAQERFEIRALGPSKGIVTTLVWSVLRDGSNGRTTITVCAPSSAEQPEPIKPRG